MRYVTKRMALVINRMCVSITGGYATGRSNIRDGQSLGFIDHIHINESFGQTLFPDLHHQAAAYLFYVIKNHVFLDGNKRTGLLCAVTFLQWNGVVMKPLDEDEAFDFIMEVAGGPNDGAAQIPRVAEWLKANSEHPAS